MVSWSPEDDSHLCERLAAGERRAGEELVARHLEPLYEFVHYRVGGHRERAEDVVQDTFVVALSSISNFDRRSSLHSWLIGIARNKLRAERRRRRPAPLSDILDEATEEIDEVLAQVAREPLPEEVLGAAETRDLVGAALSSLPADYRAALIEKYVDGLTTAQIAERANKSAKATESLLTRSRLAFARVLELLAKKRGGLA